MFLVQVSKATGFSEERFTFLRGDTAPAFFIKNSFQEIFFIPKTAELQKDVFEMQQKVKRYKEHIYELESELEERGTTIATYKEKVLVFKSARLIEY